MQKLGVDYLRALVAQYPRATLQDYCERVQRERRVLITPQTICKLLQRLGLSRAGRRQLQREVVSPKSLLAA
jgi:hypothetical protein